LRVDPVPEDRFVDKGSIRAAWNSLKRIHEITEGSPFKVAALRGKCLKFLESSLNSPETRT
jgi:hypothetical protein